MCRWFAYISPAEECLLEDVLISPPHSISKQVHEHYLPKLLTQDDDPSNDTTEQEVTLRNRLFNVDGLGLCWYTDAQDRFTDNIHGPRPALYRTTQPPLHEENFRSICQSTATKCCFSHIRSATAAAITPVNNHPFVFGRHAFMHNGFISDFVKIAREMCNAMSDDAYANIKGATDSEHLAALYMTVLGGGKHASTTETWEKAYTPLEMCRALERTVSIVISISKSTLGDAAQASSLNLATTDGERLVATRCRNHATSQPPSLYFSESAGVTLNRKYPDTPDGSENKVARKKVGEHGRHIIVASEPSTYKKSEWTLIEKNQVMIVDEKGGWTLERFQFRDDVGYQ